MSVRTHTAVLSVSPATGTWRVFVTVPKTVGPWPEHVIGTRQIPVPAARTAALALLGYEGVEGAEWQWCEDTTDHGGPVRLLAGLAVRERAGGVA
ncbi:hypothetical protein SAMN04487983_105533 [Streptomyces sp. yr375]|uniref:DUF6303 family protein n=1 Tax=Streptomyces sp. yr375 TaxID=1761906 RepID=UPI0008C8E819|nr:DUF6303 family protein [Streptomyces sp. yr375]SES44384.1 hypothetical protein SAMN04487983_105533 [Streptomyces sp. yr375]